jgi:SAM-dependent methyltransferase
MNILNHNRHAWDARVDSYHKWTLPVCEEKIAAAKKGDWEIFLTPKRPVPREWFPDSIELDILCLGSGGGQQGPLLAAAGARVTVFDLSPKQLAQDVAVAQREGLKIEVVEGDMQDLSCFQEGTFDLIINPVSNCFVPDVRKVWLEAYRVLKVGGQMMVGIVNPVDYCFDGELARAGIYLISHSLPYSDLECLGEERHARLYGKDAPFEFGHTLEDQIGGQIDAGFVLTGFFEDIREDEKIGIYMSSFLVTRAVKMA